MNGVTNRMEGIEEGLNIETLKKCADLISHQDTRPNRKQPESRMERIMKRFGWHRQYTILIIDKSKLGAPYPFWSNPNPFWGSAPEMKHGGES